MTRILEADQSLAIELQPVTAELFCPYGDIIQPADPNARMVNAGTAVRHDISEFAADLRPASRLIASVFETRAQYLPVTATLVERHRFSQQAIVAMQGGRFILAVCLPRADGTPDLGTLKAFLFPGGSGAIYRQGIWHAPIIGLDQESRFFVQSWQDNSAEDCEELEITPHLIAVGNCHNPHSVTRVGSDRIARA